MLVRLRLLGVLEYHEASRRVLPFGPGIGNGAGGARCGDSLRVGPSQGFRIIRVRVKLCQRPCGFVQEPVGGVPLHILGAVGRPDGARVVVGTCAAVVPGICQHVLGPDVAVHAALAALAEHNGRRRPDQFLFMAFLVIDHPVAAYIVRQIRFRAVCPVHGHAALVFHIQAEELVAGVLGIGPPFYIDIILRVRALRKHLQQRRGNGIRILVQFSVLVGMAEGFLGIDLCRKHVGIKPDCVALMGDNLAVGHQLVRLVFVHHVLGIKLADRELEHCLAGGGNRFGIDDGIGSILIDLIVPVRRGNARVRNRKGQGAITAGQGSSLAASQVPLVPDLWRQGNPDRAGLIVELPGKAHVNLILHRELGGRGSADIQIIGLAVIHRVRRNPVDVDALDFVSVSLVVVVVAVAAFRIRGRQAPQSGVRCPEQACQQAETRQECQQFYDRLLCSAVHAFSHPCFSFLSCPEIWNTVC